MRDYKREPLKRGELIPRSELFNRYIMENRTYEWCTDYFNVSLLKLKRCLRIYGITKPIILKQQAIKRSNLNHYGVSHPRKETIVNDRISNKVKQTCMQRYGVENVSQLQSIKEKIKKTKEENSNHSHCRAMSNNTNNITTHSSSPSSSHVHYFQTEEFKNKSISTCKKKYNVEYYTQSKEFIQNRKDLMNIRYKAIPNISIAKGVTLVDTLFTWIKSINDNRSNNNSCYREDILLQATNLFKDDDSNTYKSTIDKKVILKCLQDKYGRVTK